ncbi:family 10 glycosylhydrolase [Paenibacillus sp. GYB003]|uniref:family 10 glycosylhydrolase n=1 Tax=Paenibacillus sp. GYB003 TaxID=2994392 RepID=UPI002F967ED5
MVVLVCLLATLFPLIGGGGRAQAATGDFIEVEAAPADGSIVLEGPRKQINIINQDIAGKNDFIALFSKSYTSSVTVPRYGVAVQVDAGNKVLKVVNPSINGAPPVWEPNPVELPVPEGGFVLLALDDSYANKGYKKYLATNFKIGDLIKLRKNGSVVPLADILPTNPSGPAFSLLVSNPSMYTTLEGTTTIQGSVKNYVYDQPLALNVGGAATAIAPDGSFTKQVSLGEGTNYIDVVLSKSGQQIDNKSVIAYWKTKTNPAPKEVLLWVDQSTNAKNLQTSESVLKLLTKAKEAGVTGVLFDVKGYEGFASYKKNDLTGRPYVSNMTGVNRAGANPDLDLLQEFITHGHALGLKIHAAMNVFAEGSMDENAVLDAHPSWEERVYRAEDKGAIVPIRQSAAPGKIVAFVNPANDEVRDYQLKSFEEVMKNYDVDGINLDRGRYDSDFADFSDESKAKFRLYLQARGKTLEKWPDDVYKLTYEANGQAKRVEGKYYTDWWAFRSSTIESFTKELRAIVDRYSAQKGKRILMSTYVGSWYETLYTNGINWASPDFRYDPRLNFPESRIYTDDYYKTGYIRNLDFIMIGSYQKTAAEVSKYVTLGNILTRNEIPMYASIALADIAEPALQREVFQASLKNSDGLMLFEYSLANFDIIKASLEDREYVKSYQLGFSKPGDGASFIEGDFVDVNRGEAIINVYTNDYGTNTNTGTYGVEISVDGTGKVVDTRNKRQAIDWVWTPIQLNNSPIPQGGFVISAMDKSGVKTRRQLIANTYSIGDEVRAAVLHGFRDYDGKTFDGKKLELKGSVDVLGYGKELNVLVNGKSAKLDKKTHRFSDKIKLQAGANPVKIEVFVDGRKTNEKTITITGTGKKNPNEPEDNEDE